MPTYLTPGVYVEEVPSANKPIEGVSTSIAAFVGLAPGGPVNTPMRISNWTQFAKIYGDPSEPDNGPFMDGAYMAHSVYGFFQNGGSKCWIVRVGSGENGSNPERARAAVPVASHGGLEAYRVEALSGVDVPVQVEVQEGERIEQEGEEPEQAYRVTVTAGEQREEFDGLLLRKGRKNLATTVTQASQLIKLKDLTAQLPEDERTP